MKKRKNKNTLLRITVISAVLIIVLLFRMAEKIGDEKGPRDRFRVVRVIDGDTVELVGGDRIRLLGIDSPERGEPFYDSAGTVLAGLVEDRLIEVKYSQRKRDRYGRILGYLFRDSLFINAEMTREGLALVYLFDDNLGDSALISDLLQAQKSALARKAGIWGIEVTGEPYYINIRNSLRFHRPWCRRLENTPPARQVRFGSRREALELGLSPCRDCRP